MTKDNKFRCICGWEHDLYDVKTNQRHVQLHVIELEQDCNEAALRRRTNETL